MGSHTRRYRTNAGLRLYSLLVYAPSLVSKAAMPSSPYIAEGVTSMEEEEEEGGGEEEAYFDVDEVMAYRVKVTAEELDSGRRFANPFVSHVPHNMAV